MRSRLGRKTRGALGEKIGERLENLLNDVEELRYDVINLYQDEFLKIGLTQVSELINLVVKHCGTDAAREVLLGRDKLLSVPFSALNFYNLIKTRSELYALLNHTINLLHTIEMPEPEIPTKRAKYLINLRVPALTRERVLLEETPTAFAICRLHNRKYMQMDEVVRLAEILDVSPRWLFALRPECNVGIYSDDIALDELISRYLLLPDVLREKLVLIAQAMTEGGSAT